MTLECGTETKESSFIRVQTSLIYLSQNYLGFKLLWLISCGPPEHGNCPSRPFPKPAAGRTRQSFRLLWPFKDLPSGGGWSARPVTGFTRRHDYSVAQGQRAGQLVFVWFGFFTPQAASEPAGEFTLEAPAGNSGRGCRGRGVRSTTPAPVPSGSALRAVMWLPGPPEPSRRGLKRLACPECWKSPAAVTLIRSFAHLPPAFVKSCQIR